MIDTRSFPSSFAVLGVFRTLHCMHCHRGRGLGRGGPWASTAIGRASQTTSVLLSAVNPHLSPARRPVDHRRGRRARCCHTSPPSNHHHGANWRPQLQEAEGVVQSQRRQPQIERHVCRWPGQIHQIQVGAAFYIRERGAMRRMVAVGRARGGGRDAQRSFTLFLIHELQQYYLRADPVSFIFRVPSFRVPRTIWLQGHGFITRLLRRGFLFGNAPGRAFADARRRAR